MVEAILSEYALVKILAEGVGEWDGTITNPSNPNRRDTQMIRSLGYMVFEIDDEDNAGLWPFHCVCSLSDLLFSIYFIA